MQNNTTLAQLEQITIQQWQVIPMHRIRRLICDGYIMNGVGSVINGVVTQGELVC